MDLVGWAILTLFGLGMSCAGSFGWGEVHVYGCICGKGIISHVAVL